MSTSTVAQPPATLLEPDVAEEKGSKPFKISEHRYGKAVVTLLGKEVKAKDGTTYTRKFFNVEKIYKPKGDAKWESTSYFEPDEFAALQLAVDDARRAQFAK